MQDLGQDEVHLWVVSLSAHHVDPSYEHDYFRSQHMVLSDHLLKRVEDHVLVLTDALRHISEYHFETVVENTQGVVFSVQANSVQHGRNDERQKLLTIFSDVIDYVHNSSKHQRVVIDQSRIVQDFYQLFYSDK